jgi:hypothetical protein
LLTLSTPFLIFEDIAIEIVILIVIVSRDTLGDHSLRVPPQRVVKISSVGVPVASRQLFLKDYMPQCYCKTVRLHEL